MVLDVLPAARQVSGAQRLQHDGWVSEFESFQRPEKNGNGKSSFVGAIPSARSGFSAMERGGPSTASGGYPTKAVENLQAEIKLLHWHKLANEAALKAALLKTKKIKSRGGGTSRPVPAMTTLSMPTEERAAWMQQVIDEEQSKPLQVSKDFMCKYEEQERETEGRLDSEVAAHIRSLRNLRKQIEKRGETKAKRVKYRVAQKQLELEKQQLLIGKLQETGVPGPVSTHTDPRDGAGDLARGEQGPRQGPRTTVGALNTVLGSLDKLVELEKRISSLEKSNVYDDFRFITQEGPESTMEGMRRSTGRNKNENEAPGGASSRRSTAGRPGVGSRNRRLSFCKQTTEATIDAPSQSYYSIRVSRKPSSTAGDSLSLKRWPRGNVANVGSARQHAPARVSSLRTRGGVSTFLTQLPDVHRKQGVGRKDGGGGFRGAIGEKKRLEAKRKLAGTRAEAERVARQDRIIREWMKRKRAAAAAGSREVKPSVLSRSGGATAAGGQRRRSRGVGGFATRRSGPQNVHLQEFRNIRAHYAKRSERLRRHLSRSQGMEGGAVLSGTRTVAVTRPRVARAPSLTPFRPGGLSRTTAGLQREGQVSRVSEGTQRRYQSGTVEIIRGGRIRRTGEGPRLRVSGAGLKAARARRQESASLRACNMWRRDRLRPQHTTMLPTIRGVERSSERSCGGGGGRSTVGVGLW